MSYYRFTALSIRVWMMCIVALQPCAASTTRDRFLWSYQESTTGWGDKMHFYASLAAHAAALRRTVVLPPFQIATFDYRPLARVDIATMGWDKFAAKHPSRSWDYLAEIVAVEVDSWFNVSALPVPAISNRAWIEVTGGVVNLFVLPSTWHGCAPTYDEQCADAQRTGKLWLSQHNDLLPPTNVDGTPLHLTSVVCSAAAGNLTVDDSGYNPMYTKALLGVLCDQCGENNGTARFSPRQGVDAQSLTAQAVAATTLGLGGWCLRSKLTAQMEAVSAAVYRDFHFLPEVENVADLWLQERQMSSFLAVHWRRSDVLLDFHSEFEAHTPEHMLSSVQTALARLPSITDVLLITDNFLALEVERFRDLLYTKCNVRMHRFSAHERYPGTLPTMVRLSNGSKASERSVAIVQSLFMDLALAGRAQALITNYYSSNFAQYIQGLRSKRYGHNNARQTYFSTTKRSQDETNDR
mmetsp:Transcript_6582/g.16903  ORF Transcript_6582/g.16903 Transcript_6582/m.16903 type:complete len:467 (+) Transcript_6582:316-1716(+)